MNPILILQVSILYKNKCSTEYCRTQTFIVFDQSSVQKDHVQNVDFYFEFYEMFFLPFSYLI